jgi:hypothetical protein
MRSAPLLVLVTTLVASAGCAKGVGEEHAAAPTNEEPKEVVWEVVKVELPGPKDTRTERVAGVEIRQKGDVFAVSQGEVFGHTFHVAALGIDCRYCHKEGEPTSAANAVAKSCWNCHQNLAITRDGVRLTPDNFAKLAAGARHTQHYLLKPDAKKPGEADLVACSEQGVPEGSSPAYRATYKDDGDTRIVTLTAPPIPVRPPGFPLPERGPSVVLHMKKKAQ